MELDVIALIKLVIRGVLVFSVLALAVILIVIAVPGVLSAVAQLVNHPVAGYGEVVPSLSPQYVYQYGLSMMFGSYWMPVGAGMIALGVFWLGMITMGVISKILDVL